MKKIQIVLLLVLVLAFISSIFLKDIIKGESPLENALDKAGDNRVELDKVLAHYSVRGEDSLKLKAAIFLIENMPGHYSIIGSGVRVYYDSIRQILDSPDQHEVNQKIQSFNTKFSLNKEMQKSYDINYIKSDYLISHIDSMFKTRNYPWAKGISFEDFCENVLPYRIVNEPIQGWFAIYSRYAKAIADSIYRESSDLNCFVGKLVKHFSTPFRELTNDAFVIDLPPNLYKNIKYGSCKELNLWTIYTLRSLGLPVSYDFTPNWANRSLGHDWTGIVIDQKYHPFQFLDRCNWGEHLSYKCHEIPSKIYRRTYSKQKELLELVTIKEELVPFFRDEFLEDVSDVYTDNIVDSCINISLTLDFNDDVSSKIVHLMVFNNQNWVPVGWGQRKGTTAFLNNVRKNCCFLLSSYSNNLFTPLTMPFYIGSNDQIIKIIPQNETQKIFIKRKYPPHMMPTLNDNLKRLIGGVIQTSSRPDFKDAINVYTIKDMGVMAYNVIDFEESLRTRYLRYVSAPNSHVFLAEIHVYDQEDKKKEGRILGTEGSYNSNGFDKKKVFDGESLTHFDAPTPSNCWVGLDFGRVIEINKIAYLPVNDDNHVNEGELYELFYWDNKWISLGEKYGDHNLVLEYDNVPLGALLLLKNHTKGKQERIFTYDNDQQTWW